MSQFRFSLSLALFALTAFLAGAPARAQSAGKEQPLDISAEQSLEWYQEKGLYVARGDAIAKRGDMEVRADLLTAKQSKTSKDPKAGPALDLLTAEGHVVISSPSQKVYGDRATYDLSKKVIKVTGKNLRYVTPDNVVTARDSLEYFEDRAIAVARGDALAVHQGNRMKADILSAQFEKDEKGQTRLDHMSAKGHVLVVTKDGDISRGERARYDAKDDVAYLMENVRITHGKTQLAGDKAIVHFKTGESRLINSGSGRVRALLPTSNITKEKNEAKDDK